MEDSGIKELMRFDKVDFHYGGPLVLEQVDFTLRAGEFLGIVGPNAGGKTTLLKLMLGLLRPTAGTIRVLGKTPRQGRRQIGYCPQYAGFPRDFPITVEETVILGRLGKSNGFGRYTAQDWQQAERAMQATAVLNIRQRPLPELSGGQMQRVLIARALASEPALLLLDEPTANIDMRSEGDIFDLLKVLNHCMTIVVVSHDIGFISEYVTRVVCVNRTLLCHDTAELTGEQIELLYGGHVSMIEHQH